MRKLSLILLFLICKLGLIAQAPVSKGASEVFHHLKKLNTLGSVLYIAAHPDDENTRLLSYLANEKRFRTAYLSLTRGDGGQNLIGKEQAELLGLIRTQELLAARRVDGAEQFFTRANDFGYSKNPEETFSFWNKDSVLYDVVMAIRKFKPDVIICRFPTTGEGGHGHHTASAILALEAFEAAADPSKFPDQLKYTEIWQAKRILWNTFNFGTTNTTAPDQIKLDVGVYNSLLGKGYGEIAAESRSMHKSQGFGSAKQRGSTIEYFKLLKGEALKSDLFEGINTTWNRIKETATIQKTIDAIIKSFDTEFPEKSISALTDLYKLIAAMPDKDSYTQYWKKIKLKEIEQLILWCSGLFVEATSADYIAIPGEDINITAQIVNRNNSNVKLKRVSFLNQSDTLPAIPLKQNELYTFKRKEKLSGSISYSNPYWLNYMHSSGSYTVKDISLIGKPENDGIAKVVFEIIINDLTFLIERNIVYKSTDPVKGEVYRPLEILPPVTINFSEKVIVYTHSPKKVIHLTLTAKANKANVSGKLKLNIPTGWVANIDTPSFVVNNKGDEVVLNVELVADQKVESTVVSAEVEVEGKLYSNSIKRIEYDHIPYQFILSEAEIKLVNADIKKGDLNIGYIPGAGDDVAACLKQIGYNVTILTDDLLLNEDLSKYSAIVTGVRAYNTNDRLQVHYNKLMEYIKAGGNLVVQYNTNNRIGPVVAKISPYPLTISRDRVTDELANVSFVNKGHPALNFPNVITNADFDNWIQERGIYFANELDKAYQPILEMNDPNEKITNGSLIIAPYGKGNFVYTGLAFFRELPAGVPGAYRLFVNLLSLPKNK
ncbi:MAG: PIG-L family deacetylase [Bacteroidetes bacterium]|nr:PIG-L family deacetylase [Bacteroidota bacterium]